jgi:predicted Rossmann fold nucleotide-binding protein DprA/Smf involved in DNA uptake
MNTYTVTIQLEDREQFQHFVDNIGPLVPSVVIKVNNVVGAAEANEAGVKDPRLWQAAPSNEAKPVRTRAKRVSKVNTAIENALQSGPKSARDLKQALEEAHLSPGSVSTGLAQLQKSGQVERLGGGLYGLAGAGYQAAAE